MIFFFLLINKNAKKLCPLALVRLPDSLKGKCIFGWFSDIGHSTALVLLNLGICKCTSFSVNVIWRRKPRIKEIKIKKNKTVYKMNTFVINWYKILLPDDGFYICLLHLFQSILRQKKKQMKKKNQWRKNVISSLYVYM